MHRKISVVKSLFNKVASVRPGTSSKRDSGEGVFLSTLQVFQNKFLTDHLRATASGRALDFTTNSPNSHC